jgi:ribosomal protein S18 acetylase RimI-like enzyme
MSEIDVRKATAADVLVIGRTLGQAFLDDPAMSWAVPDRRKRERHLARYFELLFANIYLAKDETYVADDGKAAMLWAPPGNWQVSMFASRSMLPIMVRSAGTKLPRAMKMLSLMEAKHKERTEPHYYLPFIGTEPASQGKGYGTALLHHMLERCDTEGVPAYLEASSPANQALYFRSGFEVIEELTWPANGPPFWPMWRRPR